MGKEVESPKIVSPKYNQEETFKRILEIISRYNQEGDFVLEKIEDRHNFADIMIDLSAQPDFHFYIFRDHFQAVATFEIIGKTLRWDLDDVLNILEVHYEPVPLDTDIVEATEKFMRIPVDNLPKLQEFFSQKNRKKSIKKIQKFLDERRKKYIQSNYPYISPTSPVLALGGVVSEANVYTTNG